MTQGIVMTFLLFMLITTGAICHGLKSEDNFYTTSDTAIRGAVIDNYNEKTMIIRLTHPSDIIKKVISNFELSKMSNTSQMKLLSTLGKVEKVVSNSFNEQITIFQQLLPTSQPVYDEGIDQRKLDISILRRQKRNPLRLIVAFLRVVKPATRVSGKLTKYGKFIKTLKYTGYAASAGVIGYEIADAIGVIPDYKYNELTRQIDILHENQIASMQIIENITIITSAINTQTSNIVSELSKVISETRSDTEMYVQILSIFQGYLNSISTSLLLLLEGKLTSNILSLSDQRTWIEQVVPSPLLNYIGTITPNFKVSLKAIDDLTNQLILSVEVPKAESSFQLLNFLKWEPSVMIKDKCYTSPKPFYYLAYPIHIREQIISSPILIDPQSCLNEGFILCEADSIRPTISDLNENVLCSHRSNDYLNPIIRNKRSDDKSYQSRPIYDIGKLIENTITENSKYDRNHEEIEDLMREIKLLKSKVETDKIDASESLKLAETKSSQLKIAFFIIAGICSLWITCGGVKKIVLYVKEYKKKKDQMEMEEMRKELGLI